MRAKHYQENKEIPQKRARQRYQNLSKEVKKKEKRHYGLENFSEDEKQNLVEYRKKHERMKKKKKKKMLYNFLNFICN